MGFLKTLSGVAELGGITSEGDVEPSVSVFAGVRSQVDEVVDSSDGLPPCFVNLPVSLGTADLSVESSEVAINVCLVSSFDWNFRVAS